MIGDVGDFLWRLLGGALVLVIAAVFCGAIASTGLAPQPGDPFFSPWLDATRYGWQSLLLIFPGIGAAAYLVLTLLPDSGGF